MTRSRGIRRRGIRGMHLVLIAVVAAAGLSLLVRWSDFAGRFAGEEPVFQIEVQNGTSEKGAAMEVAKELRRRGVDVLIEALADLACSPPLARPFER